MSQPLINIFKPGNGTVVLKMAKKIIIATFSTKRRLSLNSLWSHLNLAII